MSPDEPPRPARRRRRPSPWATALLVALGAYLILVAATPPPKFHVDTVEDLLVARQCEPFGACPPRPPGFPNLYKGTLWFRFLAAAQELDLGARGLHHAALVLTVLGVGAMFLGGARAAGRLGAWVAAAAWLVVLIRANPTLILWNPTLAPAAAAPFAVLALAAVARPTLARIAAAAVMLGVAIELHPQHLALAPPWWFALALSARRPLPAVAGALLIPLALHAAVSPQTVAGNLLELRSPTLLLATLGAAALGAVAAWWLRRLPRARSWTIRHPSALWLATYAVAALGVLAQDRLEARYLLPAVPFVVLGLAPGLRLGLRRLPFRRIAVGALVAIGVILAVPPIPIRIWSHRDTERIARALEGDGAGYQDVFGVMGGHNGWFLMQAMGPLLPVTGEAPSRSAGLAALKVDPAQLPAELPAGWTALRSDWGATLVLRRWDSPLRLSATRRCFGPAGDARCFGPELEPWSAAAGRGGFVRLNHPALDGGRVRRDELKARLQAASPRYLARFEVPVVATDGWRHVFAGGDADVEPLDRLDACSWRLTAVSGLRAEGALPGSELWIAGGPGALVVEAECGSLSHHYDPVLFPALTETRPGERLLRQWLGAKSLDPPAG